MKLYGIVGWKDAGKTGLMERLVAEFVGRGLTVSTVKHAHHEVDIDRPGKDSYRHRAAGAREVLLATSERFALMHELRGAHEPPLEALLARLSPVDLVLIEGFKSAQHPKLEVFRGAQGHEPIAKDDPHIRAVAAEGKVAPVDHPVFDLNDTVAIADFIAQDLGI
ncbi:MAG: molybdopterin-guanine dinucleotide biosynthesis protein B [Pseudomonadota bacterium]